MTDSAQVYPKAEDIKQRVQHGIYTLCPKANMRSVVWESFRIVFDEFGEEIFGVSCCVNCHTCIRYKAVKNGKTRDFGTKNLRDHLLYCGLQRRGRKEKKLANDLNLSHEISDISSYKFHLNHSTCDAPSTSVINELVNPAEVRSVGDLRHDQRNQTTSICKVENLEDGFLEEIENQVSQIDSQMTPEVTQLAESAATPLGVGSSSKDELMVPSYKRIRIMGNPQPPSSTPVGMATSSESSFPPSGHQCSSGSSGSTEASKEDEHDIFGRHVANELRSLPDDVNRRWARFQIQKVLFDAHSCQKPT